MRRFSASQRACRLCVAAMSCPTHQTDCRNKLETKMQIFQCQSSVNEDIKCTAAQMQLELKKLNLKLKVRLRSRKPKTLFVYLTSSL